MTNVTTQSILITSQGADQVELFLDGVSLGLAREIPALTGQPQTEWVLTHDFSGAGDGTFQITAQAGVNIGIGGAAGSIVTGSVSAPFAVTIDTVGPGKATPIGTEFLVNTATENDQTDPAITALANGGFVVSWRTSDSEQDGNSSAIKAQIFDATGGTVGGEFLVNTEAEDDQTEPAITALDSGGFVVSWRTSDSTQDGSSGAIKAQIFDAVGAKVGAEFLVNTEAVSTQEEPAITSLANGGFVVSWSTRDPSQDGNNDAIKAQIFDATGGKVGDEFLVNTEAESSQIQPAITALANGGFVVSWTTFDSAQDGSSGAIKAQIFDATGGKVGAEFLVNTEAESGQEKPAITALANGGFVVSWRTTDSTQDGSDNAIKAQIFDATGDKVGAEFLVNTATENDQTDPAITALANGGFVVSWRTFDSEQDGSDNAIKAQIFDATGAKVGAEFLVNTETEDNQILPAITALEDGKFVIAWETAENGTDLKAQLFQAPPPTTVLGISDDTGSDAADGVTNDTTLTFNGTSVPNETVEVFLNGVSLGTTAVDETGLWTFDHTGSAIPDGQYQITAQALDLAGNTGQVSDPFALTVDTSAPGGFDTFGGEILVNEQISLGDQTAPDATTLSNGNVVVVFLSKEGAATTYNAQIFAPNGAKIGGEFEVSPSSLNGFGVDPKVVALEGGGFVVLTGEGKDARVSLNNMKAQIFDANGTPAGAEFFVEGSPSENSIRIDPEVAALPGGGFIAAWEDDVTGDIFARAVDATGAETIAEFQVNDFSASNGQSAPQVVALAGGGFVIGWSGKGDTSEFDSFRIFNAAGVAQANQKLINNLPDADDSPLAMTALSNGGFAVAFVDDSGGAIKDLTAIFYDATGTAGSPIDVAANLSNPLRNPDITQLADGNILVTWEAVNGFTADTSGAGVFGQVLDQTGALIGDAFLVNTLTEADQTVPTLTPLQEGGVFAVWQTGDPTQDGDGSAIKAQVFGEHPTAITGFRETSGTPDNVLVGQGSFFIDGTGEPGATIRVNFAGPGGSDAAIEEALVRPDGTWSVSIAGINRPEGLNTFTAVAFDAAGNQESGQATGQFTVDNTLPSLSAIDLVDASDTGSSSTDNITSDTTPTIRFTAEAGAAVQVFFDPNSNQPGIQLVGTGAPQEVTLATPYTSFGSKPVLVSVLDAAGNADSQFLEITIGAPLTAAALALAGNEDTVISGIALATGLAGDALTFGLSSGPANGTATVAADGTISYTPVADFNGTDSFVFSVSDGNGGTDTETVSVSVAPVADTIAVGTSAAGTPGQLNGNSFTSVGAGDKITVTPSTPFSSSDVTVDPSTGLVTIPGASFTVDIDLAQNGFLVVQGAGGVSEIVFLDVLQGNGADLLEGQAVAAEAINGIVPTGFLSSANANSFQITLDASQGTLDNALGSFVRNADGSISDVQVLFGSGATQTGNTAPVSVAEGGTLEFFLIQDFGNSGITLADALSFDFSSSTPELVSDGNVLDLEIFFSGDTSQNSDGVQHFLSGVVEGGGALRVGVEDLLGGGDQDYQDFVFTVAALDGLM